MKVNHSGTRIRIDSASGQPYLPRAMADSVLLFHLQRKNGESLFVHPLAERERLLKLPAETRLVGKYGQEPRVESVTLYRNALYRIVEREVRDWIADVRFIPRFLISAGVFLLTYLFWALVVRDAVPLIDEILVAIAVAVFAYVSLGRRQQQSDMALKKRIALRSKVDGIAFEPSEDLARLEEVLQKIEEEPYPATVAQLDAPEIAEPALVEELRKQLEQSYGGGRSRRQLRRVSRAIANPGNTDLERTLSRWVKARRIDYPVFLFLAWLRGKAVTRRS